MASLIPSVRVTSGTGTPRVHLPQGRRNLFLAKLVLLRRPPFWVGGRQGTSFFQLKLVYFFGRTSLLAAF